jgi:hypothetical protein
MVKHRFPRALITGPILPACALLLCAVPLAGCGGSGAPAKSVAALSSSGAGATGGSAAPAPTSSQSSFQRAVAYAECMRSHGVSNFPDPTDDGSGKATFRVNGINPQSATFQAAEKACQALRGAGQDAGGFDPTKIPGWVDCVRKHGVPDFPYPTNTGTGMQIDMSGVGVDQDTLQKALNSCQSLAPGGSLQITVGKPGKG